MKKLIHVSCASAYKYPETPLYIMVKGKKYDVKEVLRRARIQSANPPFDMTHYFKVSLENDNVVEIEYHENTMEWYLLKAENFFAQ